jgi:hypothetical protein
VGYNNKGRLEERVGLIVLIAHSFEEVTPCPVTKTVKRYTAFQKVKVQVEAEMRRI